jgi:hypothetical protein
VVRGVAHVPRLRVVVRTVVLVQLEPSAAAADVVAAAEIAEASTLMVVEEDLVVDQDKAFVVLNEVAAPYLLEGLVVRHTDGS